jgi:hypothetical protein
MTKYFCLRAGRMAVREGVSFEPPPAREDDAVQDGDCLLGAHRTAASEESITSFPGR